MSDTKHTGPVFKLHQPDDSAKFQPMPAATGEYPYHLKLSAVKAATQQNKMVFQMLGDSGSVRDLSFLHKVAAEMTEQFTQTQNLADRPQFLYHLGDIVYNHGEASEYHSQFFEPFSQYPAPIFAIAGNHDADVNPDSTAPYKSLDAFNTVFCDSAPRMVAFSKNAARKSMIQPNVYWVLETPLATIIGLYSNVPKFGIVTNEQHLWFVDQLKLADAQRPGKAIIVCMHHAPYSADINHGSSIPMITFLQEAFTESGVTPDIVLSGHVHNYQRFSKVYANGGEVTFVVAGAGGYDELHSIARIDDDMFTGDNQLFDEVKLQGYCDDRHGFLTLSLEKTSESFTLKGEFFALHYAGTAKQELNSSMADSFTIGLK
ncbi:metallophosphoesterase [Mucilaginibacter sp. PAMC 26640]|nr:metallophosphoesterase [Mucilaginibacter sp. PAMC 26640]